MREYRPAKRVKLYVQDQYSCSWCGKTPDDGVKLNLDHVIPRTDPTIQKPQLNLDTNLLTSCETCTKTRQDLPVAKWIDKITSTPAERDRLRASIARKLADRADKAIMRHAKRKPFLRRCTLTRKDTSYTVRVAVTGHSEHTKHGRTDKG